MIQPIKNIFSNWRNPQHKPIDSVVYDINNDQTLHVKFISDTPIIVRWEKNGNIKESSVSVIPEIGYGLWLSLSVDKTICVIAPYNANLSYLAYKLDSEPEYRVLVDER